MTRVVAGTLRGRRLRTPAPERSSARPTSDRVKTILFDILGPLPGIPVLDLFAGTGALGIEAISRGASTAVLVESDPVMVRVIEANRDHLELAGRLSVQAGDAHAFLRRNRGTWGLVLADPPYGYDHARRLVSALGDRPGALELGARLALEHDAHDVPPDRQGCLELIRRRQVGRTTLSFYRFEERGRDDAANDSSGDRTT